MSFSSFLSHALSPSLSLSLPLPLSHSLSLSLSLSYTQPIRLLSLRFASDAPPFCFYHSLPLPLYMFHVASFSSSHILYYSVTYSLRHFFFISFCIFLTLPSMFLCLFVPMFLYTAKSIYSSNEAADSKQNRTGQDRTEEVVKTVQNRTGHCRTLRNIAEHRRAEQKPA
jgi:ABC-type multidrug transport system fused ATPase/permease subunit